MSRLACALICLVLSLLAPIDRQVAPPSLGIGERGSHPIAWFPLYPETEECCVCPPRPPRSREAWAVGLAHWYSFPYIGRPMANGDIYTGEDMTIAIRVDLLDIIPLSSTVKISSYCGIVTATVTDAMPIPVNPAHANVIVDVSPAVAGVLFCEGYGYNKGGIAYGEELVLVEVVKQ